MTTNEYVKQSFALHLFFARIMKEHSFFLQISFTQKDYNLIDQANTFRMRFDELLRDVIILSNGVVDPAVLHSEEIVTPYTENAENLSEYFTGVNIPTKITQAESALEGSTSPVNSEYEQKVNEINNRALQLVFGLIQFKTSI